MSQAVTKLKPGGVQLPSPGEWAIDRAHSSVGFVARHLVVAKVRGRFKEFSGSIQVGETLEDSSVDVTVDAESIDTAEPKRDEHLRSGDFLEVDRFPHLRFTSSGIRQKSESALELTGELIIRDVARPVVLDVEFMGLVSDLSGSERMVFSAFTEIDREEWGLTWNQALETGGVLVGRKVRIELDVEAVKGA